MKIGIIGAGNIGGTLARRLVELGHEVSAANSRGPETLALSVAGDGVESRNVVLRLVDELGFDPVDAGGLDESWRQQPGTPAYCQDLDAGALRHALAAADRDQLVEYRVQAEVRAKQRIAAMNESAASD